MTSDGWENTFKDLQQLLGRTRSQAEQGCAQLKVLRMQVECYKIAFLIDQVHARRRALAGGRGLQAFKKDSTGLGAILGEAAINLIGTALITQNKSEVLSAGLGAANKGLQNRGETAWVVNLDSFIVAPRASNFLGPGWVEWPGLITALEQLKKGAENGEPMGDLHNIKKSLMDSKLLIFIISIRNIDTKSNSMT